MKLTILRYRALISLYGVSLSLLSLFLAAAAVSISPLSLLAADDDPSRGRLSDGRAYRTDSDGNQLVDYIAELEQSVEELRRELSILNDDLIKKNSELAKVSLDQTSSESLVERDLSSSGETPPKAKLPPLAPDDASALSCEVALKSIKSDLKLKAKELDQLKTAGNKAQDQDLLVRLTDLEKRFADRGVELESSQKLLVEARGKVRDLTEKNQRLIKEVGEERFLKRGSSSDVRQAAARAALGSEFSNAKGESLEEARTKAVSAYRVEIDREISEVERLVAKRAEIHSESSRMPKPVTFTLTEPLTSDKLTLPEVRKRALESSSMKGLSQARAQVLDIKRQIVDDIALLTRLRNIGSLPK